MIFIIVLFVFCWAIQIYLWVHYSLTFSNYTFGITQSNHPHVTVLICAKNEEENIQKCIESILDQEYPHFKILIADDYSEDGTAEKLMSLSLSHQKVQVFRPSKDVLGKKLSINEGVAISDTEWILMTDADCLPRSNQWIDLMMSNARPEVDLILGYGGYKQKGHFINKLIRYETVYISIQYFSAALKGQAYMGVGRNMAFRKKAFENCRPFKDNLDSAGDDDSIVLALSSPDNTKICLEAKAHTISEPSQNFNTYFEQKRRHIKPIRNYPLSTKVRLGIVGFSHVGVFIFCLLSLFFSQNLWVLLLIFVRWILMYFISRKTFIHYSEKSLASFIPVGDLLLSFFYFLQLLYLPISKKNW